MCVLIPVIIAVLVLGRRAGAHVGSITLLLGAYVAVVAFIVVTWSMVAVEFGQGFGLGIYLLIAAAVAAGMEILRLWRHYRRDPVAVS